MASSEQMILRQMHNQGNLLLRQLLQETRKLVNQAAQSKYPELYKFEFGLLHGQEIIARNHLSDDPILQQAVRNEMDFLTWNYLNRHIQERR